MKKGLTVRLRHFIHMGLLYLDHRVLFCAAEHQFHSFCIKSSPPNTHWTTDQGLLDTLTSTSITIHSMVATTTMFHVLFVTCLRDLPCWWSQLGPPAPLPGPGNTMATSWPHSEEVEGADWRLDEDQESPILMVVFWVWDCWSPLPTLQPEHRMVCTDSNFLPFAWHHASSLASQNGS
jgi:hypothetical protein